MRREEGEMRRNGNGGGRIETSGRMNNSIDGGRKCTKAVGKSTLTQEGEGKEKRGNVEKREVSVQTEIQLLYSWLDQLKNEGKVLKSPNPYHHDSNLHPHLTQHPHLLNPSSSKSPAARGNARILGGRKGSLSPSSPSSNKSHLLGSRRSSSSRFLSSSLSSSKSPSPTSFPSPPNFPSSGHQNFKGQTKWTRDANQATWKPVGDVIGRSGVVTKGFTNKSRISHESHLTQPLIRPSYGRKFVVTKP